MLTDAAVAAGHGAGWYAVLVRMCHSWPVSDSTRRDEARVAALYKILGTVAHDISNPLQALVMHAELAADDSVQEQGKSRDGELQATRRMQTIVRALTGLAAVGVHDRPLGDALRRFETLLSRRWTRLGLRVEIDIRDRRNVPVPAAFEEALLAAGIEMSVWLRARPPRHATLVLTADVRDEHLLLSIRCDQAEVAAGLCETIKAHAPSLNAMDPRVQIEVGELAMVMRCKPRAAAG